jgi:sulfite dehydrogenase (cytochrome) subunit B
MMKTSVFVLGLTLLIATPAGAGESVSITLPPESVTLEPGAGMEQAQTQCRQCHSLDYITMQPRVGAAQWQGVVTKMRTVFGAPISDADAEAIARYLATHYGPR